MVKPTKPSCFLSHGTISHSIISVNSVSEFGFRRTTTLRVTNVNLRGVGLGLACEDSSLDDTVHVVVRFSTQALHWRGRGWLVGNECNRDFATVGEKRQSAADRIYVLS